MVGHGRSSVGSYLADPTSPIPSHCAVIILFKCPSALVVVTSTLRGKDFLLICQNKLQLPTMPLLQTAMDEAQRRNLTSMFIPTINPVNPCLVLYVSRNNIVGDTIAQLTKQGNCDFKKPLKVTRIIR